MQKNKQELIVTIGYYVLIILGVLFFYKKTVVPNNIIQAIYAVLFLGILPTLLIRKGFKQKLDEYNFPEKYARKQVWLAVVVVWVISLLLWMIMLQWGGEKAGIVLIWKSSETLFLMLGNLIILPMGLLAQEFFFRGFVLNIFIKNFNKLFSIGLVSLLIGVFSMFLSKSFLDWRVMIGVFVVNVALSFLTLKTKSVVFSFFVYWLVVVLLNFYALYQLAQAVTL